MSLRIVGFAIAVALSTPQTHAVPPPDFLFAVGSQIGLIFSVLAVLFSSVVGGFATVMRSWLRHLKHPVVLWTCVGLGIVGVAYAGARALDSAYQDRMYQEWLRDSERYADQNDVTQDVEALDITVTASSQRSSVASAASSLPPELLYPPEEAFIINYYTAIAEGRLQEAYDRSSKPVDFATYQQWYKNVADVRVEGLQNVRDNVYAMRIMVEEGGIQSFYAVLMTLGLNMNGELQIMESDVHELSTEEVMQASSAPNFGAQPKGTFFAENADMSLSISNKEFEAVIGNNASPVVLDAREDEEFEIGHFPIAQHIRFADLLAGAWIGLPTDTVVYVFCWSGIRGKEVAQFLRSKGILARYIESGANGWVQAGGEWDGGIKFLDTYTGDRYQFVFSTKAVHDEVAKGTVLVDTRPKSKYDKWHIPGSVNIPIIYTPSSKKDEVFGQVVTGSTVITVCDDFVSCFDAKVTGVELEDRGHTFLGRYNKPWDYRNTYR